MNASETTKFLLFAKEKYFQSVMPTVMKFVAKSKPFHELLFDFTIINEIEVIDWWKSLCLITVAVLGIMIKVLRMTTVI